MIKTSTKHTIRWVTIPDMQEVTEIEELCFNAPYTEQELVAEIRRKHVICRVIEDDKEQVAGFILYKLGKDYFYIIDLAIHPSLWRKGFGSELINYMKAKLKTTDRAKIAMRLSENNTDGHLFLKSQDFKCTKIEEGYWREGYDEKSYLFEYIL